MACVWQKISIMKYFLFFSLSTEKRRNSCLSHIHLKKKEKKSINRLNNTKVLSFFEKIITADVQDTRN